MWYFKAKCINHFTSLIICILTDTFIPQVGNVSQQETTNVNQGETGQLPAKTTSKLSLTHKELIETIRREKEKFLKDKKAEEDAAREAEIEQLVNNSKVDDTGAKGITGGEPADELTKERRNFIKRVS